jgi:hypothetical protein
LISLRWLQNARIRLFPEETTMTLEFAKQNIMRLVLSWALGALLLAAALTPKAALAHEGEPSDGTFVVSVAVPSALDFCTSEGTPNGISVEAQGSGIVSGLGPLFLKITKCVTFAPSGLGTYAGNIEMTAGNGDTLKATYAGQDTALNDPNGFGPFQGTWAFTGGTGRFSHASGALSFTAIFSGSVNDSAANGQAYYLVRGTINH